jgi:hypothetical protein
LADIIVISALPIYQIAIYTSRLLDTKSIKSFLKSQNLRVIGGKIYSRLLSMESVSRGFDKVDKLSKSKEKKYLTREQEFDITNRIPTSEFTKELAKRIRTLSLEEENQQKENKSIKLVELMEKQEIYSEPIGNRRSQLAELPS